MHPEELAGLLGEWGRFQTFLAALTSLPLMLLGFQLMMVIVILAVPDHRCRIPSMVNDTFRLQSERHGELVKAFIPLLPSEAGQHNYDPCHVYVRPTMTTSFDVIRMMNASYDVTMVKNASYDLNRMMGVLHDVDRMMNASYVGTTTAPVGITGCSDWVYDVSQFQSTVITQFNLVCDQKYVRAHFNMIAMIGALVGAPLSGFMCDWLGRKPCYFATLAVCCVVGTLSAFPQHPLVFLVCRFLLGAAMIGGYQTIFVLLLELVGPSMRNRMGSLVAVLWLAGPFLVAAISFVVRHWQVLQLLGSLPYAVCLTYWWFLPESPRWLLSKGRVRQAEAIVRRVARVNRVTLPPVLGTAEDQQQEEREKDTPPREGLLQLLKYPTMVVRMLIIVLNWCVVAMTYFGLSLNVSNLAGSVRVNFLLSNAVELLGYSAAWLLLDRLGRKRLHCSAMLLAGIACLASIFTVTYLDKELQWVTTVLAMVGKLGISASFSAIYIMTVELVPTTMRNFGMGCSSSMARVSSAAAPYIADLALYVDGNLGRALPQVVFAAVAVTAGLLSLLLPETLGRKLPDSLEEAANFGKTGKRHSADKATITEMKAMAHQQDKLLHDDCQ